MNKQEMLESVRNYLSSFGKPDEKILKAIEKTDRKNFMDLTKDEEGLAYEDTSIHIGHGQTISQPSTVARMLSLLKLKKTDYVLEIGTGSAWNACLIGYLSKKVLTLEIVKELAEKSKEKIKKQGLEKVVVKEQDFRKLKQKFDKIIFTAGISPNKEKIIENFAKKHLKENGILICPYRSGPLMIFNKPGYKIKKNYTQEHYIFVPLILK